MLSDFVFSHPEGISAISPGLSEARATPRVPSKRVCTPEGVPATLITPVVVPNERETLLASLPGCVVRGIFQGCRFAQPLATGCEAFGFRKASSVGNNRLE